MKIAMESNHTQEDLVNASRFGDVNTQLRYIQLLNKKAPHITSWLQIKIRKATADDYFIPQTLEHACKVIDVQVSKDLCEQISCIPMKEKSKCDATEEASLYRLGDDAFGVQCQPACFNLTPNVTNVAKVNPDISASVWNDRTNKCAVLDISTINRLEKPYYRSDVKYEKRVNDMPTGFSRIRSQIAYGAGITYANNKTYCAYFDRIMTKERQCDLKPWEKALDFVVGMTLINTIKAEIRLGKNNQTVPFAEPEGLPPFPPLDAKFKVANWKTHVNKDFKIPDFIDTKPRNVRRKRDVLEDFDGSPTAFMNALEAILHTSHEAQLLGTFAIQMGVDLTIDGIKKLLVAVVENSAKVFAEHLAAQSIETFSKNILTSAVRSLARSTIVDLAVAQSARIALTLTEAIGFAATGIGFVLTLAALADIVLTFWDPTGYMNVVSNEYPDYIMRLGEVFIKKAMQTTDASYNFEYLKLVLLTKQERDDIASFALFDHYRYLAELTVNSNGSRIVKGPTLQFNSASINTQSPKQLVSQAAKANRVKFDVNSFKEYNAKFDSRVTTNKYLNFVALGLLLLAGLSLLVRLYLLSIAMLILMTVTLTYNRVQMIDDTLVDAMQKLLDMKKYK